jgi:hypothetical protein
VDSFTPLPFYTRGKGPQYPLVRLVGPKAGLDGVEKRTFIILPGLELQPLRRQPVVSRYTDYGTPTVALPWRKKILAQ